MIKTALLIITLLATESPHTVVGIIEVPQDTVRSCQQELKQMIFKLDRRIKDKINYRVRCIEVGKGA